MTKFIRIFVVLTVLPLSALFSAGLDLDLYYGTRYVGLGGNHVGLPGDAYSPFYNPAAMTSVENGVFALNSSTLYNQFEAPIGADNAQRKSEWNLGPLFYVGGVYKLTDRVAFGLAVFPTALQGGKFPNVDYAAGAPGGTNPISSELSNLLVRIEIAPSLALKVWDNLSLGLSYRIAYTRFDNSTGAFFPSVGNLASSLDVSMDGWDASGLKVGAFLDNWNGLSAGLTYRLEVKPDLSGTATVSTLASTTTDLPATLSPRIPAQFQAGLSYEWIPDTFMTAFTYEYTYNSALDLIAVNVTGLPVTSTTIPLHERDSHAFHLGGEYTFHLAEKRKLHTDYGIAYDLGAANTNFPNAVLEPAAAYLGYAGAVRYEFDAQTLGLALNYGKYSKHSTPDASLLGREFTGKYSLAVWFLVADWQYKF